MAQSNTSQAVSARALTVMRRPLLVLSIAAAGLLFFKVTNVVDGFSGVAIAAEEEKAEVAAAAETAGVGKTDAEDGDTVLMETTSATPIVDPAMMSQSELALLRDLSSRRNDLDARETELEMRSRLLQATERRVESKISDLKTLEGHVKSLLVKHEDQENQKIVGIVKVYEKMKAADAARILEGLDMSIQIDVAQRMSQLKMAPIMAKMSGKAAQRLSTELATKQTIDLQAGVN